MSFQHIYTQTGASGVPSPNSSPNPTATSKKSSMGATDDKLKALLPTKILVDQLVVGKTKQSLLIRILRMWEAKNFKLNGVILSLDLLMLDEKDNLIQGSIYYRMIHMYKDLLEEGTMYLINNLEVVPSYSHYKVIENPFTVRFTDRTQIIKVPEEICFINREKFRIHSFADFQSFAGSNINLFVLSVQGSSLDYPSSKHKIMMLLLLDDNSTIRMTLWDDQAAIFRHQFENASQKCIVIVATCLNPKVFGGKLHLNSSGATKIYIDHNLQVVKEFMKKLGIETAEATTQIVQEENTKAELETLTIQEIFDYFASGVIKAKEVICLKRK